jgi:hypothetical protein
MKEPRAAGTQRMNETLRHRSYPTVTLNSFPVHHTVSAGARYFCEFPLVLVGRFPADEE